MSIVLGLTGPSGAGKSVAAAAAEKCGFFLVDCDKYARKAVEPGCAGLSALTEAFGNGILLLNGALNRKALARVAFSSEENTLLLNRTLLPFITELIKPELDRQLVLLDAPTLYEGGLDSVCNFTIAVLASREKRTERIISRDHLTPAEAELRLNAGKPDSFYIERADKVLYNDGSEAEFTEKAAELFSELMNSLE